MHISGLWRYPVKSLAGEPIDSAHLDLGGVEGDRVVHVRGPRGPLTGRQHHRLVTIPATTGAEGAPLVAGHAWDSSAAARIVREAAGVQATLAASTDPRRFDILNLLVATDGAVRVFGHDVRRLRPNMLIAGVGPAEEIQWPGQALAVGDALIGIHSVRDRCVVTTIDPDSGALDPAVFRHIRRAFGGRLALNSWVIRPGTIRVGDPVRLVPTNANPEHLGGWIVGAPYRLTPGTDRSRVEDPADGSHRLHPPG